MSIISKLTLRSVERASANDPVQKRRTKLISAIEEQLKVAEAQFNGDVYEVQRKSWVKNEQGEKVLVERMSTVRPWYFEQDGGWYVQCKYGNRVLDLGKGNAVFVKKLEQVVDALLSFKAAVGAGELDKVASKVAARRK